MGHLAGHGRYGRETYPSPPPPAGGGGATLTSGWGDSTEGSVSQGGGPTAIVASTTVTPAKTGKFRVWVTGTIQNDSDSGQVLVSQAVGHGPTVGVIDYTGGDVQIEDNGGGREYATLNLVVDLDRTATPVTFPLGTPVEINAVLGVLSGGQAIQWADHQVQIAVQERDA